MCATCGCSGGAVVRVVDGQDDQRHNDHNHDHDHGHLHVPVGAEGGRAVTLEQKGLALFDLGEAAKVVISSVTEGADKPAKYPNMFRQADLVLLNKTDLLPYVDFDVRAHAADLRRVSPASLLLQLSAATGEGLSAWF